MPHLLLKSDSRPLINIPGINKKVRMGLREFSTVQCQEDGERSKVAGVEADRLCC
jgi:hypothetical protein